MGLSLMWSLVSFLAPIVYLGLIVVASRSQKLPPSARARLVWGGSLCLFSSVAGFIFRWVMAFALTPAGGQIGAWELIAVLQIGLSTAGFVLVASAAFAGRSGEHEHADTWVPGPPIDDDNPYGAR